MDCRNCGNCCKDLESLQIFEIMYKRIKSIRPDIVKFVKKVGGMYFIDLNYSPCPFLEDNKCSIYSVRPLICREFPFKFSASLPTTHLVRNRTQLNFKEVVAFSLCERFDTVTEKDYQKALKIMKITLLQYEKVFKRRSNIVFLDKHLKDLELKERKFSKELNYALFLKYCKFNPNFIRFTRLLITYFRDKTFKHDEEYGKFLRYYSPKFEEDPKYIDIAISDLEKRINL